MVWKNETQRHSMAKRGIRTKNNLYIPAMGIGNQYKKLIDAFPESKNTDIRSTIYHIKSSPELGHNSWSYKYGYFSSVWDNPENIKDNEWLINLQKQALIELDLNKTHVKLGEVPFSNPNEIYYKMQGEFWSKNGEAKTLVRKKGTHTSMSIGDIIKTPDNKLLIVAGIDFLDINELKKWHGLK